MKELAATLLAWQAEGIESGRAMVVRTFGSAPRAEGAVLLVAADGRIAGSVSGGCVEGAAAEEVQRARRTGRSRVIRYGISDEQAWSVGLACGGTIDVLVEPIVGPEAVEAAILASGIPAGAGPVLHPERSAGRAIVTPLPADSPGPEFGPHSTGAGDAPARAIVASDDGTLAGSTGSEVGDALLARAATDALERGTSRTVEIEGRSYFVEAYPVRPRLVIVGAVQVAIPLVAIARTLGYETIVVDGRPAFATRARFPDADRLVVAWPDEAADDIVLGPSDAVAVLSHDVKFDEPAIVTALGRHCRYVGAVGSRRTQEDRRERLRAAGVADDELERLRGPIGLDLGGRNPAETALAIMAEIVAARYGGTGQPMRDRRTGAGASVARDGGPDAAPTMTASEPREAVASGDPDAPLPARAAPR